MQTSAGLQAVTLAIAFDRRLPWCRKNYRRAGRGMMSRNLLEGY